MTADRRCETCKGPSHPNAVFQASHPAPARSRLFAAALLVAGAVYLGLWAFLVLAS